MAGSTPGPSAAMRASATSAPASATTAAATATGAGRASSATMPPAARAPRHARRPAARRPRRAGRSAADGDGGWPGPPPAHRRVPQPGRPAPAADAARPRTHTATSSRSAAIRPSAIPGTSASSSDRAEAAVGLAVVEDPLRHGRADAGQHVELLERRRVQVDRRRGAGRGGRPRAANAARDQPARARARAPAGRPRASRPGRDRQIGAPVGPTGAPHGIVHACGRAQAVDAG